MPIMRVSLCICIHLSLNMILNSSSLDGWNSPSLNASSSPSCHLWKQFNLNGMYRKGDLVLGGLFEVHFFTLFPELSFTIFGFKQAETMAFAIDEINKRPDLLPNITLGYQLYDNCLRLGVSFRAAMSLASGSEEKFLLDENCSGSSPVSYYATCSCLSNRRKYPSFFRTIPSDTFQVEAMIQILRQFGWTWVGLVVSSDDYGLFAARTFLSDLTQSGGCMAYSHVLPKDNNPTELKRIVENIKQSSARVLVVISSEAYLLPLVDEVVVQNVRGLQWIASEAWTSSSVFFTPRLMPYLGGTLGIAIRRGEIPGLRDHLLNIRPDNKPHNNMFWETMFECEFKPPSVLVEVGKNVCTGQEDLRAVESGFADVSDLRPEYNVYKAVYALAHALHDLLQCVPGRGPFSGHSCASIKKLEPWQPVCCFDCIPCAEGEFNSTDCYKCPEDFWSSLERDHCIPKGIEFLSYNEPLGISLTTASMLGTVFCAVVFGIFAHYRNTPVVKANNSELSFLLLLSLKLCFLCSLLFIGRPRLWTCQLRHAAFGISFVLCVSCILVKTMVVLAVFRASKPGGETSLKWFGSGQQRGTVLVLTSLQAAICVAWLVSASPTPHKNTNYQNDKIVYECVVGSVAGFGALLGYIGLLASLSFLLAFLARNLPDNFNEAKLITFSMLIFCAVWVAFVPAYVSSPGKYADVVEIFAILASSFGLLVALFGPKCYIILLRPERNTKKALMGRAKTKT
uniref:G-protein coupled receptors family 3 profile domain-containing protein n=1 Tax=Esox lucius TaxID=8010 RepID=A0AAY5K4M6_ESOLU